MATTSSVPVTPGLGDNLSTFLVNRDGQTEHVQATAIVDATSAVPLNVDSNGRISVNVIGTVPVSVTFPTTQAVSGTVAISGGPVAATIDGTAATGVAEDTGGVGSIGWFSSMVKNLRLIATSVAGTLSVSITNQNTANASTTSVAVTGAAQTIKGSAGKCCRALCTAVGTGNPLYIYDSATQTTGKIIGIVPGSAQLGESFDFYMDASVGISLPAQTGTPSATVSFA